MKLGTLLLRDGVLTLDQLEAALRQQVLFGGKLGTNLVELGHLTLDQLTHYLARTLGVEPAGSERFENADPRAVAMVPAEVAAEAVAFPLAYEAGPPARVTVAFAEPRDKRALGAVSEVLGAAGAELVPVVAPELRILFYVERHYGVKRRARWVRVAAAQAGEPGAAGATGAGAGAGAAGPPAGTERRRHLADESAGRVNVMPRKGEEPPRVTAAPSTPPPLAAAPPPRPIGLADTLARLEEAGSRDTIAEALLRFLRGRYACALLLLLRDGMAVGWRGFALGGASDGELGAVALPLDEPSCLKTALDGRSPWRGKPSGDVDARLLAGLGAAALPEEALVAPVAIGPRIVNLLYAHGPDGAPLDEGTIDGLLSVAEAAGEAYARLIQRAKNQR